MLGFYVVVSFVPRSFGTAGLAFQLTSFVPLQREPRKVITY